MKQSSDIKKHIHAISNVLHNAYETLENIELCIDNDRDFCLNAIAATKKEREEAFDAIENLRRSLKNRGIYE